MDILHIYKLEEKTSFLQGINDFFDINIETYDNVNIKHTSLGASSYLEFYTPQMIEIVNRLYDIDFKTFGYDKLQL
jgi:hypothetical protein